jgi:muramoyltetrapeptide carboxypeptidase
MQEILPPKLRRGDMVRVVAPALSRALVLEHDHRDISDARFAALGLSLSYGRHVDERDVFDSSPVSSRVADLHEAFQDPSVRAVLAVIGGFNSNELLPYLDWDLIRANPKILCGYSDITALQNAILARTGLVTFSGPNWAAFGMRDHFEQVSDWFTAVTFGGGPVTITPSFTWTDDAWFLDQDDRKPLASEGWWAIRAGAAQGRLVGGNMCTLNLLQGTPYLPSLSGAVLAVEDDARSTPSIFARQLTSLFQVPAAAGVRGLLIGRFQRNTGMTRSLLTRIVAGLALPAGVPVLGNADFGHTFPMATLPVGGQVRLVSAATDPHLTLLRY